MTDLTTSTDVADIVKKKDPEHLEPGSPALRGYDTAKIYAAAAHWLTATADQLEPEPVMFWSPNLLFELPYAAITASMHGLAVESGPVVMSVAWFTIGDLFGPTAATAGLLTGPAVSPGVLTDPLTDRTSIIYVLRSAAQMLQTRAAAMTQARTTVEAGQK